MVGDAEAPGSGAVDWAAAVREALAEVALPFARRLDAETAHRLAVRVLGSGLLAGRPDDDDPILAGQLFGRPLANPIGLAAGLDKDAAGLRGLSGLGFGAIEVGTVTPLPQPGNPTPRLFRLAEDQGVVNRLGFNNKGLDALLRSVEAFRPPAPIWLGINVGKNKTTADDVADFVTGVSRSAALADYLVVNVSSPNTPGLRDLQGRAAMTRLLAACLAARDAGLPTGPRPPLLVKLAPDLDEAGLADAAEVALELKADGLILGNTTVSRPAGLRGAARQETGGLSGRPLFGLATRRLTDLYRLTEGRLPLVGCGGVASGAHAYAKIRAGASLVQLYTALVYEGPGLVRRIKRELADCLRRDGFGSVGEAVGADHR